MRAPTITESLLTDALAGFFGDTCTIQSHTDAADGAGQLIPSWSNLAGHIDIACRVAPISSTRPMVAKGPDMTTTTATHIVYLPSVYPSITTAHRVVWDAGNYEIVLVLRDSEGRLCELFVQEVTT